MEVEVSNPTRDRVEQLWNDGDLRGAYWDERALEIAGAYLRALDMRDGIERCLKQHRCGERLLSVIGSYIKKFDGRGDEQKHEPAGEWDGGHTR